MQQTVKGYMRNLGAFIQSRRWPPRSSTACTGHHARRAPHQDHRQPHRVGPAHPRRRDDYDPLIARDVVQTTADLVEDTKVQMLEQDKQDRVDVSILDYALPGSLHKPKWKINVLAGAIFGMLAGAVVILAMEWLEADIIRTSADMERHSGLAVLGVIPDTSALARPNRARRRREQPRTA